MAPPIITSELVLLDADAGPDSTAVITTLADLVADAGRCTAPETLVAAAVERETKSATGLPGGIAIPHARVESVTAATLAMARLSRKADFGGPDGPADIVFLIAAPAGAASEHMKVLSSLARALVRPDFVAALREAPDADTIVGLVSEVTAGKKPDAGETADAPVPAPPVAVDDAASAGPAARRKVIAITACPTGIAHTYMAADALKLAAERADVDFQVETQGSTGSTPFSAATIADANAVIFATDVGVKGRDRFVGKAVVASGVKRAINEPDAMIAEAIAAADDPHAATVSGDPSAAAESSAASTVGIGGQLKQALLTGVSYMIPFVAAGGLLMALGFLLGGYEIANSTVEDGTSDGMFYALNNSLWDLPPGGLMQYLGAVSFAIGNLAIGLMVAVLAGYIAYAIADRPGLAPGFTAGLIAVAVDAGFIGGLVGGLLAGVVALWLSKLPLPQWARGLQPVVIIPLVATLVTGFVMFALLARPLSWVNTELENQLNSMSGSSKVILGVVIGLMMCFDLGGPVNKAAYAFGVAGLGLAGAGVAQWEIMAAVMAAGMVPPLALALATLMRPAAFTEPERENGKAAWLLGASFISEGAIPFAAADPFRVIPSMMLGGAVTGGLAMAMSVQVRAPHGGVFVLFAMNGTWWKFLIAIVAGVIVSAVAVLAAKQIQPSTKKEPTGVPVTA
ncbi:fructose-specific PTS transporter subunit EIIC [Gordonia sp. (in: high G+C Gram-positive bacteria)]|uniref:PTS fructose transporter subunit IIABC n=1 Tax=Gordonia sp. (in: high G+C Gram-positive bacteria) TaxID=84139 RepID=UPI001693ACFA|nr:fructose-specific PTS transporter subunit EIIC [Gordonia sp. (in: high G+C Gram-positive bacteria)]NLG45369.1 PTS transporter subunit EIIA [Gordonia sp. (in: high G+C Gram-positive bacteria)]